MYKTSAGFLLIWTALVQGSSIFPGAYWTDSEGVPIQAHGGGFLAHNNAYYWFGEDKTENSHNFRYVNCYQSFDLIRWELLGHALSATEETSPISEIGPDSVVERPKVLYNQKNQEFVMWFHLDSSNYGLARLGVAVAKNIQGPYTYQGSIAPFGQDSRDMTVWVDPDDAQQQAYVVYATKVNLDTSIATLTDDYRNVSEHLVLLEGIHREAYAVFKKNGLYYIVMSRATGWDSNPNEYMTSTSMKGPWSAGIPIAPSSQNTFDSQANYVIPLENGQFIYCGDRWNRNDLSDSRYMWLPIDFGTGNSISISWKDSWWVDTLSGGMGPSASKKYGSTSSNVELIGDSEIQSCSGCEENNSIGYIGMGGRVLLSNVIANTTSSYSVLISYTNGDQAPRYLRVNVNQGQQIRNVTFPSSGSGQVTKQIVFQVSLTQGQDNSLEFFNEEKYGPDIDYIQVQCYYSDC